jgi:hypothetical protein
MYCAGWGCELAKPAIVKPAMFKLFIFKHGQAIEKV